MILKSVLLRAALVAVVSCLFSVNRADAGQLFVGASTITITPEERVALDGQFRLRVSESVESPCVATAVAIETRDGDKSLEQAIFVSCDLVILRGGKLFYDEVRAKVKGRIPDSVLPKIVLNATHTHTAPVAEEGLYPVPESGVMGPTEYREFLMGQLAEVITKAWEAREAASVAWGLGHTVIAHNRRAVYADGTAKMYGNQNDVNFRGTEGTEDHGVELLYFWNEKDQLIASAINVACPSQEVEGRNTVNADFWHPVREKLRKKHGDQLHILAWTGASGDQSPHVMFRKAAEARMLKLRGIDSLDDLSNRIVATWEDVLQVVKSDRHSNVEFSHQVETIRLPYRQITALEANTAKVAYEEIKDTPKSWRHDWFRSVYERYEQQQKTGLQFHEMELHVVRLEDIAIATNDFELFTDYGVQIKSRSPALQTFVIQLSGGGTYLPTARAAAGGGYSAIPESTPVGPEGGQVLVNETVRVINSLWKPQ